MPVLATHLSTTTSSPWVSQALGPLNRSTPAQKSTRQPALMEESTKDKEPRSGVRASLRGVSAPHRTSCCGALGRLLDFSEFSFLYPPEFPLSCAMDVSSAKWGIIMPYGPTHGAVLGSMGVESPLMYIRCKGKQDDCHNHQQYWLQIGFQLLQSSPHLGWGLGTGKPRDKWSQISSSSKQVTSSNGFWSWFVLNHCRAICIGSPDSCPTVLSPGRKLAALGSEQLSGWTWLGTNLGLLAEPPVSSQPISGPAWAAPGCSSKLDTFMSSRALPAPEAGQGDCGPLKRWREK